MKGEHTQEEVRVRIAPSPTGPMHLGTVRTALFNWLFARSHGGKFILRIEDTDKERSKKEHEEDLIAGFQWLGLTWDEGPYRQSERTAIYKEHLETLLASGHAYYCYCTKDELEAQRQALFDQGLPPRYIGHCRNLKEAPQGRSPQVIRFKVPEIKVEFNDMVRGNVAFDATLFGDIVIAKDLESPLYNFAVVVDDALMRITHVIRAEDHVSNTPKQILIQRALGFSEPKYAHIPLILNPDRSKMSKRFADTTLSSYREKGYTPDGLINFLALLGWHPQDNEEVMSREALINAFDITRVQQAGAVFSEEKLDWMNREQMRRTSIEDLEALARPFFHTKSIIIDDDALFVRVLHAGVSRAKTLVELADMSAFYFTLPEYDATLLSWKEMPKSAVHTVLQEIYAFLDGIPQEKFTHEILAGKLPEFIGTRNRGEVLWPLRVSLSGQSASPDPIEIMSVLGKERSLARIKIGMKRSAG